MNREGSSPRLQVPAKRYRIGELVRYSPFSRQTIHNYTIMGLIREAEWTEGGHRLYDETVFDRLSPSEGRAGKLSQRTTLPLAPTHWWPPPPSPTKGPPYPRIPRKTPSGLGEMRVAEGRVCSG